MPRDVTYFDFIFFPKDTVHSLWLNAIETKWILKKSHLLEIYLKFKHDR